MKHTFHIPVEITIHYEPAEPESGLRYPYWQVEDIEFPCFNDEQNYMLFLDMRSDMEEALIEYAQRQMKT